MIKIFFTVRMKENSESPGLLYTAVRSCLGKEAADAVTRDEKGRPVIRGRDDIFLSVSHTGSVWIGGVSDRNIGIDVEFADRVIRSRERILNRIFSDRERELLEKMSRDTCHREKDALLLRLWTKKEAYLKLKGTGFSISPGQMCTQTAQDVSFLREARLRLEKTAGSSAGRRLTISICLEGAGREEETADMIDLDHIYIYHF